MTTPRIFVDEMPTTTGTIKINEERIHYLKNVLRLKAGAKLFLSSHNSECEVRILQIATHEIEVEKIKESSFLARQCTITVCQALLKSDKIDLIVQKITELGVAKFIPFVAHRSVARYEKEKAYARVERWRKISKEATRKSYRHDMLEVEQIVEFAEALKLLSANAQKIIFWEEENEIFFKNIINDNKFSCATDICFIVGPEGGLTHQEVELAKENGFVSVSLGDALLNAETATIAVSAIIAYEKDIFGGVRK